MVFKSVLKPAALAVAVAVALTAAPVLGQDLPPQKVVYHNNGSSEPDYYKHFLANVRNHINAVGRDNIEIVVVGHGNGLSLLSEAEDNPVLAEKIDALKADGVRFMICANTLRSRDISLDDLYGATDEDVVVSGVAEIARLEQQGFVYLHP